MERIVHSLVQGTPAWDEFRLTHFGASEIAAVLGLSKKTTRTELLRAKKTGIAKEFSAWLRDNVLDRGHEIEALARPLAVEFAGVDGFYPVTVSIGRISASSDGLDMPDEAAWECKSLNAQNGPIVRAGQVPEEHMPQCQQVLMTTGADRLLFTVSDGTRENTFHTWVEPDTEWFDRIRAAWAQFEIDLETHEPVEATVAPVGRAPESLPALHIVLRGEVSASNLAEFKDVALNAIRSVNRDLQTDQDFADSAKARKWCSDIETRVAAAKEHALSQTADIEQMFRTLEEVGKEAREVRLSLEKLEKGRTETRKGEIVAGGVKGLADHIRALNERLGKPFMPAMPVDFGGAIKGMRSFDSMQNAVDTALANAKITANATADRIDINLKHLNTEAGDFLALFPDIATVTQKDPQDFIALVQFRVADQRAKDAKRAAEQRDAIRREEEERAANVQAQQTRMLMSEIQGIQQQVAIASLGRAGVRKGGTLECIRETLAETEAWPIDEGHFGALFAMATSAKDKAVSEIRTLLADAEASAQAAQVVQQAAATPPPAPAAAPAVAPVRAARPAVAAAAPTADTAPTLSLGTIKSRIAPIEITAAGLSQLGFTGVKERGSVLYHEHQYPQICAALIAHLEAALEAQPA